MDSANQVLRGQIDVQNKKWLAVLLAISVLSLVALGSLRTTPASAADGDLDTTFTTNAAGFNRLINVIKLQPNGKILVGGTFQNFATDDGSVNASYLVRLNSDGTPDHAFNKNVGSTFTNYVNALALQSDGGIIAGGDFATPGRRVLRLNSDGTSDAAFNANTTTLNISCCVKALVVDSNDKIVVGGDFTSPYKYLARLNADGTSDTTFNGNAGTSFSSMVRSLALQSNGQIVVGGDFTAPSKKVARLNDDGTTDLTFTSNISTTFNDQVRALAVQVNGKIVVGGKFGSPSRRIARLNSDGTPDTKFNSNAATIFNNYYLTSLAIQGDGKIVAGGYMMTPERGIARLNSSGTLDSTFNPGTGVDAAIGDGVVYAVALPSDSLILAGGNFQTFNATSANYFVAIDTSREPCPVLSGASAPFTVTPSPSSGVSWSGCTLSSADLSGADLTDANLSSSALDSAELSGADLSGADLSSADLSGADLTGADLSSANLTGADLTGADLSGATMINTDLTTTELSRANLSGTDLSGTNLIGAFVQCSNVGILGSGISNTPVNLPSGWTFSSGTLTASSTSCAVTITLDYNGGATNSGSVTSAVLRAGDLVSSLPQPTDVDLIFTGWYSVKSLLRGQRLTVLEAEDAGTIIAGFIPPELAAVLGLNAG